LPTLDMCCASAELYCVFGWNFEGEHGGRSTVQVPAWQRADMSSFHSIVRLRQVVHAQSQYGRCTTHHVPAGCIVRNATLGSTELSIANAQECGMQCLQDPDCHGGYYSTAGECV
jgi:hypothetical protein